MMMTNLKLVLEEVAVKDLVYGELLEGHRWMRTSTRHEEYSVSASGKGRGRNMLHKYGGKIDWIGVLQSMHAAAAAARSQGQSRL